MLQFNQYVRPESVGEAYELGQRKNSVILGGMMWLRMQSRAVGSAIDLSALGLDSIEEDGGMVRVGAMTTLRRLETDPDLNACTGRAFSRALSPIVGVQFRNLATVGGSVWGRFGFSDVLTVLLALGTDVELYHAGRIPLAEFARRPKERDILTGVLLPKEPARCVCLSRRNTTTDFPVLVAALCRRGDQVCCAVGARPGRAVLLRDEYHLLSDGVTERSARTFADWVTGQLTFGSNIRGSAEYRQRLCEALVKRGALELGEKEG